MKLPGQERRRANIWKIFMLYTMAQSDSRFLRTGTILRKDVMAVSKIRGKVFNFPFTPLCQRHNENDTIVGGRTSSGINNTYHIAFQFFQNQLPTQLTRKLFKKLLGSKKCIHCLKLFVYQVLHEAC